MSAKIIDGKALAETIRRRVGEEASKLGLKPGLTVLIVGDDPASQVYVRNKVKQTAEAGFNSTEHRLPENTPEADLLKLVQTLNADPGVHGILVQLPLPDHIDPDLVIRTIDPVKDVDGFHPINAGRLAVSQDSLVPCTPQGCILLAKTIHPDLTGLNAVVLGRSNIVGKPVAQLLIQESATVTVAHSKTRDLDEVCARADLLVAAVGRAELVKRHWIKPGATVIDVGINRVAGEPGKTRLVGDVAFEEAKEVAGAITPVPGGVGPMTIACLLANTLKAACWAAGKPAPRF
jgi:methylenetetrahydrofolate dehydrogenase (NADP+) / methenyltetrahydrofolate cyclohydrolase